jgi:hypothetical protein
MTRRKATNTDTENDGPTLSPRQELAVDLLVTGVSVTAAAEACGASRQTLSQWLNCHPGFRASLNRRRGELWNEVADRARSLVPRALDVLSEELTGEKRLVAAIHVMKSVGLHRLALPSGPTDPEEAEAEQKEKRLDLLLRQRFG